MSARAHPRACGENEVADLVHCGVPGSSPRVRGKPPVNRWNKLPRRLIPARAGKTSKARRTSARSRAHPRACGENWMVHLYNTSEDGSSPRVRGKPLLYFLSAALHRLIPARAGKTCVNWATNTRTWAHPRACGENGAEAGVSDVPGGSSPRVRGKRLQLGEKPVQRGLIPARAGKTSPRTSSSTAPAAHPRACGENGVSQGMGCGVGGSSPRVRGKRWCGGCVSGIGGLIPARAGKTGRPCTAASAAGGSSPRVRGKRADRCAGQPRVGLIPARAGKTRDVCLRLYPARAHPRACGENISQRSA